MLARAGEMENNDKIMEVTVNSNFPATSTLGTKINIEGNTVNALLDQTRETIKEELLAMGADENRIIIKRGNISSGDTKTDFGLTVVRLLVVYSSNSLGIKKPFIQF